MHRSMRIVGIATIALATSIVAPAAALACGAGVMSFHDVVTMSPMIVEARVGQPLARADVFGIERVFKGHPRAVELVPKDQLPVQLQSGDRVVLALMHPGIYDGAGVTVWVVKANGRLSDAGVTDAPATIDEMASRLSAPATSTLDTGGGGPEPTGGLAFIALAALGGAAMARRRFEQAVRGV
jgi:hypothetical protein